MKLHKSKVLEIEEKKEQKPADEKLSQKKKSSKIEESKD
jgi:hypothetical protein